MITYELFIIAFLLVMMYVTFVNYKRKSISKLGLIFWYLIWFSSILLIAFHPVVNNFLAALNIMRVFDLYTIAGFLLLLFIVFYLFKVVQKTEDRVEELTRVLAIKNLKIR